MALFGRTLVAFGLLSLVHAGYSAIQYRNYLKLIEEDFTTLPADELLRVLTNGRYGTLHTITLQILLSLTVSVIGIVSVAGDLKDIHAAAELANKTWESFGNRSSFYTFSHRGKVMFANIPQD